MERFVWGLMAGGSAGALTYAAGLVRAWWYVAAGVVAFVVWFRRFPDVT
ncbi:hypothetical protein ACFC09_15280 [Streptomyces sp. NPDC056161]